MSRRLTQWHVVKLSKPRVGFIWPKLEPKKDPTIVSLPTDSQLCNQTDSDEVYFEKWDTFVNLGTLKI